jgi:flagellar hook protein FlgE
MAFNTAISGLNAASSDLNVVGNNIANSSTNGFKSSRAEFADVYPASNLGTGSNTIGSGVNVSAITQQFSQGNVSFTNNNLDLAVNGGGFFRLSDNGSIIYSRAGAFGLNNSGYISNSQGQRLTGYLADAAGNVTGALGDLQISSADLAPNATTAASVGVNLNAAATRALAPTPTSSLTLATDFTLATADSPYTTPAFTVYDTNGVAINTATLVFTSTGGNNWTVTMTNAGAGSTATTVPFTTGTTSNVTINWDPDGAGIQPSTPITIDVSGLTTAGGAGSTTTTASQVGGAAQGAFSAANPASYNNATSTTIYDSLGATHLATMYYRKTLPNSWQTYLYIDGNAVGGANTLAFSSAGALTTPASPSTIAYPAYNPGNGAANISITMSYGQTTQFGSPFGVNSMTQNGFTTGRLSGVDIDATGTVFARYTNGQSKAQGQVVLSNFADTQGLRPLGHTTWSESSASGTALTGAPGTASLGAVQSGALEDSNVNLTEQLVHMIVAQRNFQANAQVITTENAITQTIIQMR